MILNTATKPDESLSGLRKAAMLLIVLGEQTSADLLQQLAEEDIQKVSREVAKITAISSEQAEQVLNEYHHITAAGDYVARGGIDFARKLLMRAFTPDVAKRLLDRLTKALGSEAASL
jgi:flagellar motor switch protein FliG